MVCLLFSIVGYTQPPPPYPPQHGGTYGVLTNPIAVQATNNTLISGVDNQTDCPISAELFLTIEQAGVTFQLPFGISLYTEDLHSARLIQIIEELYPDIIDINQPFNVTRLSMFMIVNGVVKSVDVYPNGPLVYFDSGLPGSCRCIMAYYNQTTRKVVIQKADNGMCP